ncbi:MAG: hypothetical protein GY943_29765 [Chloroflexi bacterium]|nr:hypothetical protein [Chloroflexota bacterium]
MTESKLFEMDHEFGVQDTNTDVETLMIKLGKIKQRLLILFGAIIMFYLLGMINTDIMETDPAPQVWILLWLIALGQGVYLFASPKWRKIPIIDRRDCGIGALGLSLFAFSYMPFLLFVQDASEAIPFGLMIIIGGLVLYVSYHKLGQPSKVNLDEDLFP